MTTTIQNLSDLQDRRIMMDKKLPPYGYAFVIQDDDDAIVDVFMETK